MVDASHANSNKQHSRQIDVIHNLARQIASGEKRIMGVMIESNLHEGRQDLVAGQPLKYGVSITDACIGFDQTVPLLAALSQAVQARRCS
jgi:3-deoxy-7-phosphoheptulonate synthase